LSLRDTSVDLRGSTVTLNREAGPHNARVHVRVNVNRLPEKFSKVECVDVWPHLVHFYGIADARAEARARAAAQPRDVSSIR